MGDKLMIKVFGIYKNIKDMNAFLKFYTNLLIPKINKLPGVIGSNIIKVSSISPEVSQELDGIEMIFETYYESMEAATQVLSSPEGLEISRLLEENGNGELYIYLGNIVNFRSNVKSSSPESSEFGSSGLLE
jgi:uncharacterized protein (TIGR02118 family)